MLDHDASLPGQKTDDLARKEVRRGIDGDVLLLQHDEPKKKKKKKPPAQHDEPCA